MAKPIALSGFMGAGKTTVGARLARELGWPFVDLDAEISTAFAAPIAEVFAHRGEAAFRDMEARLLRQVLRPDCVVALGGGVPANPESRAELMSRARWVHLDVPFETLARRVRSRDDSRPLWGDAKAAQVLFDARADAYAQAPFRVDGAASAGVVAASIRAVVDDRVVATVALSVQSQEVAVNVPGARYSVRVGAQLSADIARIGTEVGAGPIALLTDWNVGPLHADGVARLLGASGRPVERVVLPAGESRKRIGPVIDVVERLLDRGWQRSAPVVALGGGVLGDMAGLVASLTLRGVPFVQLPTTLLAMVDSSVGGKVGVDHREGKNLIGAFHQPESVIADLTFLRTLPNRELRAGFAEVVKTAALGDLGLLELLEGRSDDALRGDPELLAEVVVRCVRFKAAVVAEDAKERGRRRILNFGHTLGHALEAGTGYALRHGEAVSIGMVAAAHLATEHLGAPKSQAQRLAALLESLGLPTRAPRVPLQRLVAAMEGDKKRVGDEVAWVLLETLGVPRIVPLGTCEIPDMLRLLQDRGILQELE